MYFRQLMVSALLLDLYWIYCAMRFLYLLLQVRPCLIEEAAKDYNKMMVSYLRKLKDIDEIALGAGAPERLQFFFPLRSFGFRILHNGHPTGYRLYVTR